MNLTEYLSQAPRGYGSLLASQLGVSQPTVSDWCTGKKQVPEKRCVAIERATNGAVSRRDLRPTDWQDIWPELAQQAGATTDAVQGA